MSIRWICLLFTLLFSFAATAQPEQKAEKEFLSQLNSILKKSKQQHWGFEGVMSIDSAFIINAGSLSVTVSYNNGGVITRSRMQAPVNKIKKVGYDLYIVLEYEGDSVVFFQSEPGKPQLKEKYKTNLFHVGVPVKGVEAQQKLQIALDKLLQYYH